MQSSQLRHGSASAYCVPIVTIINKSSQMSHKTIKTLTTTWQPFLFKGNFINVTAECRKIDHFINPFPILFFFPTVLEKKT